MTFTTTPLVNGGYLVEGTDTKGVFGTTILDSNSWDALVHLRTHKLAQEDFDQVVGEFFAPLVEAADKAKSQLKGAAQDWGTVTLGEQVTGHEAEVVQLDSDEGHDRLLRWVGDDKLVAIQS
jgi:hypothetical protein